MDTDIPFPETIETLEMQLKEIGYGGRKGVFICTSSQLPRIDGNLKIIKSSKGIFVFSEKFISESKSKEIFESGEFGLLLGYQTKVKPDPDLVVGALVHKRNGIELFAELVTEETLQAATNLRHALMKPGDTLELKDPEVVVFNRLTHYLKRNG